MTLHVLGAGLVSPIATSAHQHALFVEAGLGKNPPTAFFSADDAPIFVHHAPWLGARMPLAERMAALAVGAAREALAQACDAAASQRTALALCIGESDGRPDEGVVEQATKAIADGLGVRVRGRARGAASAFAAMAAAADWLAAGDVDAVLLVAVDSMVSLEVARAEARGAPAWVLEAPSPSEAAAALVLVREGVGPRGASLALLSAASTLRGEGSDMDDAPVLGTAMTTLLERVASSDVARVYGQLQVDDLRRDEWTFAAGRCADRLAPTVDSLCLEASIGRVGGAAGLAQVAWAIARERALPAAAIPAGPALCWAISADGTRGLVRVQVEPTQVAAKPEPSRGK